MAMTAAERQKRYRERHRSNGGKRRINLLLSTSAVEQLDALAKHHGLFKQVMLERMILEFGSSPCGESVNRKESPQMAASRLLLQAGGDAKAALSLLRSEAVQTIQGFSWQRASRETESDEYRYFMQVRKELDRHKAVTIQDDDVKAAVRDDLQMGQLSLGF